MPAHVASSSVSKAGKTAQQAADDKQNNSKCRTLNTNRTPVTKDTALNNQSSRNEQTDSRSKSDISEQNKSTLKADATKGPEFSATGDTEAILMQLDTQPDIPCIENDNDETKQPMEDELTEDKVDNVTTSVEQETGDSNRRRSVKTVSKQPQLDTSIPQQTANTPALTKCMYFTVIVIFLCSQISSKTKNSQIQASNFVLK